MATINIWKGTKRVVRGNTYKTVAYVTFDGECLGVCWEEYDSRGVETTVFRSSDGRIIVHQERWSRWEGEETRADVFVFPSIEDAADAFRWELEQAGIIPRPTLTLDEVDGR